MLPKQLSRSGIDQARKPRSGRGLGWNAGVVAGSTLLAASVPEALRPQSDGIGEVAMGLAAGAGAPAAGLVVAFGEFTALSIIGAAAGALMLAAVRVGARPSQDAVVEPS